MLDRRLCPDGDIGQLNQVNVPDREGLVECSNRRGRLDAIIPARVDFFRRIGGVEVCLSRDMSSAFVRWVRSFVYLGSISCRDRPQASNYRLEISNDCKSMMHSSSRAKRALTSLPCTPCVTGSTTAAEPQGSRSDAHLIAGCILGSEEAVELALPSHLSGTACR